jgi:[acyl-carrier-protein] S-malonyltransferase
VAEFPFIVNGGGFAYLFPGQGSQHVGMASALADSYPAARAALQEADDVLGFALSRLCFEGPEETLTDTVNAQPALLAASMVALRALTAEFGGWAPPPAEGAAANFVAGHSLGEYTALVAAGSLAYADALRLVRTRGQLMKEAGQAAPGLMAAILGLDEAQVAAVCAEATQGGGIAQVANDNCPGQVVISGDRAGMEAAMAALAAAGAKKVMPLAVSIAAHSPLMQPAADALRAAIEATPVEAPAVPVVGNTTAKALSSAADIRAELAAQLTGSVRWTASVQAMSAAGAATFVEVGPGEVLSGLVKRIERKAARYTVNTPENLRAFVEAARA